MKIGYGTSTVRVDNIIGRQKRMLDVRVGDKIDFNGREYKVYEVYPHFVRAKNSDREITLNKGQIIMAKGGGLREEEE